MTNSSNVTDIIALNDEKTDESFNQAVLIEPQK